MSTALSKIESGQANVAHENARKSTTSAHRVYLCDAKGLKRALACVAFSAADASTRYALGGVCFEPEIELNHVHVVATDGRRLATDSFGASSQSDDARTFIMPIGAVKRLVRGIGKGAKDARIEVTEATIRVLWRAKRNSKDYDKQITAHLVQGRFPQWQPIVKDACGGDVLTGKFADVHEFLRPENDTWNAFDLSVSAKAIELGCKPRKMPLAPADKDAWKDKRVARFDFEYLAEWFDACGPFVGDKDDIRILMKTERDALAAQTANGSTYVFMPMSPR